MTRLEFLAIGLAPLAGKAASVKNRFHGVWSLVSCEERSAGGEITYPFGPEPVGRITYDPAGRMSAQLMRPRRNKLAEAAGRQASAGDVRDLGYVGYYGTFDVDEAHRTVIHHVQAALYPSWVGTDLKRNYDFSGDKLILTATDPDGSSIRLVWRKER